MSDQIEYVEHLIQQDRRGRGKISNPAGLSISVDGKEQAQKTPASITLPEGQHRVQVTKGSDKQEFTVDIKDGLLSSKYFGYMRDMAVRAYRRLGG